MQKKGAHTTIPLNAFVKAKRKELGLTQKMLADKSGVGLRFIRELENGKPTLQMNKVNQVLMLFGYELGAVPLNRKKMIYENRKSLHA